MAFNGITMRALAVELDDLIKDSHIAKISQPEENGLILTIKRRGGSVRLLISANASLPLMYITEENKQGPDIAPNFCMLLRKHIGNGKITDISQIGLERVIRISVEHRDEMGDLSTKFLYVEIMGKHSNIIFTDSENRIIDSIKHVSAAVSSVREVLPGREYFIPSQEGKIDPLLLNRDEFEELLSKKAASVREFIIKDFIGFSSVTALELCSRAKIDPDQSTMSLSETDKKNLEEAFFNLILKINDKEFSPVMVMDSNNDKPLEFSAFPLISFEDEKIVEYDSISALLFNYYCRRDIYANMHQRSTDLRKVITNLLSRNKKKLDLQEKQYKDTEKKDTFRKRGELLRAYAYSVTDYTNTVKLIDYETNEEVSIPVDREKSLMDNANEYFSKYQKLKRTEVELKEQLKNTSNMIMHLETIQTALDLAENEDDLTAIRAEMEDFGFVKRKKTNKKKRSQKEKPLHYRTYDGFDIYVGKNNYQNDYVTFTIGQNEDWWFHSKTIPGSHVVVKSRGKELPDHVFTDAAALAAFYSSGRDSSKLEIDYVRKKEVKKPSGAAPGYVIYYTNYSMVIKPEIVGMEKIND